MTGLSSSVGGGVIVRHGNVVHAVDRDDAGGYIIAAIVVEHLISEARGRRLADREMLELAVRVVAVAAFGVDGQQSAISERDLVPDIGGRPVDLSDHEGVAVGIRVVGQEATRGSARGRVVFVGRDAVIDGVGGSGRDHRVFFRPRALAAVCSHARQARAELDVGDQVERQRTRGGRQDEGRRPDVVRPDARRPERDADVERRARRAVHVHARRHVQHALVVGRDRRDVGAADHERGDDARVIDVEEQTAQVGHIGAGLRQLEEDAAVGLLRDIHDDVWYARNGELISSHKRVLHLPAAALADNRPRPHAPLMPAARFRSVLGRLLAVLKALARIEVRGCPGSTEDRGIR